MHRILTLLFIFCCSLFSYAYSDDLQVNTEKHLDALVSKASEKNGKKSNNLPKKSDKPYFACSNQVQPKNSLYTQFNMGVGFLYFDQRSGNVGGLPAEDFNSAGWNTFKSGGNLQYNRTPVFEWTLGYKVNSWFSFAASFLNQSGIAIQTEPARNYAFSDGEDLNAYATLTSLVNLNAILAKVYFENPRPLVWNNVAYILYLGAGAGPGWQSWTENSVTYTNTGSGAPSYPLPLNQKYSTNAVWMIDSGLRMKHASPASNFSLTAGCRFVSWGQARNLGKIEQQAALNRGLAKPFKIKMVYSFAPYIGFQWNFPRGGYGNANQYITDASQGRPHAFLSFHNECMKKHMWFTSMSVGAGFLFAHDVNGRLGGSPSSYFAESGSSDYRYHLGRSTTPAYEYMIGFNYLSWLKYGLAFQTQQNISVETQPIPASGATGTSATQVLSSQLGLNAVYAKLYFQLPYYTSFFKFFSFAPYLGAGVGPGWQSWTNNVSYAPHNNGADYSNYTLPLRQKISTNCFWMLDAGLYFKALSNPLPFNVSFGCRFNAWGQARNVGLVSQQGYGYDRGLQQPFRIKFLYSFAPYMTFQWALPIDNQYAINKRCISTWKPFFTWTGNLQAKMSAYTNMNVGIGFLYFDDISGNIAIRPYSALADEMGTAPVRDGFSYNRTPLYEYSFGYQYTDWFRAALSYYHQGAVFVETKLTSAGPADSADFTGQNANFKSQLGLNAVMLKAYLEIPYAMVLKNFATSLYAGVGVGPGWQSWTDMQTIYGWESEGNYTANTNRQRQKICANAVWTVDAGLRIKNATPDTNVSIVTGCKYTAWGQARNIGKISQQGNIPIGFFKPISVRTIYSFAPYLGVQFNF